ncbi:flavoprotein [Parafrankia sp. BMG5.11]|uniref:flavoprotein n=1 Tax=Parafrankia sp. BMG5.11 TaxID=222540 RepID=UPI00103CC9C0|nr:flavoprotein [Parafrankia sp. BMG5.11]TCJ36560.1 flavoprotein [Parafrankia sp. BMG5.11]
MNPPNRVLYVVVCGAGPAGNVGRLVDLAHTRGWQVQLIATDTARDHFLDIPALETLTGRPVRSTYRPQGEPAKVPHADAVIVAPATYNTINKWAAGIADTYPLSVLAELTGLGVPIAVLPFVNQAFAANRVFTRSVENLRAAGITVLLGPGAFEPHPPRAGADKTATYPWHLALDAVAEQTARRR